MKLKLKLNDAIALAQLLDRHAGLPEMFPPMMPWRGPDKNHDLPDLVTVRRALEDLIREHYESEED
jgi:hypothetical protein